MVKKTKTSKKKTIKAKTKPKSRQLYSEIGGFKATKGSKKPSLKKPSLKKLSHKKSSSKSQSTTRELLSEIGKMGQVIRKRVKKAL